MKLKALIISIKGLSLTRKEKNLLRNERPWGIILFKRNLKSFPQIKKLINEIKIITKNCLRGASPITTHTSTQS